MKKITFLFAALLACVGVMKADVTDLPQITTDLENPIYYTIYNTRSSEPGGLMYYAGDEVGMKDGCTSLTLEDKYKFFFTGSHEELYIHNAATAKKLASVGSWTEEGIAWTVTAPTANGLAFGPKGQTGNVFWNDRNYSTDANTSDFTTWSNTDAGSIFVVEKAENYVFPVTDLFYVIECPLFENVQGVKKALYVNNEGKAAWDTEDLTDHNFYWIPTVNQDGTVALKNFGTNTYLSATGGAMTAEVANATLKALGNNSFNINIGGTLHAAGHDNGNGASGSLTSWGGGIGSASAWRFVQREDPTTLQEVVVKYSFTYGGEEKYTQEVNTLVGEEWPIIAVSFPFGVSSATKPAGEVTAEGAVEGVVTKTIELTVNLPFTYAVDYVSIENWYYIQMHSSGGEYTRYIQAVDGYIEWLDVDMDMSEADSYTWGFVGNPFDGFMLVNYGTGETKAVNSTGSDNPSMGDYATGVQWIITNSRINNDAEHFCFKYPGSNNYMNAQSGKVAFWSDNDQGSTVWVTERDLSGATELQALVDEVEATLEAWGDAQTVGCVTADSKAAVVAAVAAAKEAITAKEGYIEAQIALQGTLDAVVTIQPEEGKFYTIVNAMPETDNRSGQMMYVNHSGNMHFCPEYNDSTLFQFVAAGEGKFYLYNAVGKSYLSTAKGHNGGQAEVKATAVEDAKAATIANMGRSNVVKIVPEGGAMLHAQAGGSVVGWNNTDNTSASAWTIVEVDIAELTQVKVTKESGDTWGDLTEVNATMQLFATVTPNVGTDKTVTWSSSNPELVSVEDGLITLLDYCPNYMLVTITATAANGVSGTFEVNVMTEAAPGVTEIILNGPASYELKGPKGTTCQITATVLPTELAGESLTWTCECSWCDCVSIDQNGVVTIISDNVEDGGMVTIKATASNGIVGTYTIAVTIEAGNIDTAIESVEADADAVIYDLSGRRVEKMEKGIYIVNGCKVVVK